MSLWVRLGYARMVSRSARRSLWLNGFEPAFKSRQPDQLYLVGIHQFPPIERDPLIQMSLATRSFFIKCAMGIQT